MEECIDYFGEGAAGTGGGGNERVSVVVGSGGEDGLEEIIPDVLNVQGHKGQKCAKSAQQQAI